MKKLPIQILLLLLLSATLCLAQENWVNLITPQKIHEIYEIDDKLYCATEGGLVIYDQTTQTIERQLVADDIPSHRVEDITQDAANNIWIGTYENGLARMTNDGWEKLEMNQDLADGLTYCIEFDANGTLWAGTIGGLLKYENNEWVVENGSIVWDMEKDDQGIIYLGGEEPGKLENGVLTEYDSSEHGFSNTYKVSHIDYGTNGDFYWASGESEVVIYEDETYAIYDRNDIGLISTPGGQDPTDIIYTATGEVWVAFLLNGIYKFDGNNWEHIYVSEGLEHIKFRETSNGDFIISIDNVLYEYDNGFTELADLSIGFDDNNVKIAKNENDEMLVLGGNQLIKYDAQLNPTTLSTLPEVDDYSVLDFLVHPDGSIGFINTANGDSHYNGQTQVNIPSSIPIAIVDGINDYMVDSQGDYWLATPFGLIRSEQGILTVYDAANTPFISDFISSDWVKIQTVAEDHNGDIWVSGEDKVARWERTTEAWVDYLDAPQNEVNSVIGLSRIYFDENNVLWGGAASDFVWSGTPSIGLTRLDGNTWTSYTPQNSELESYFVNDIQEINGQLVLATETGMSIFDGTNFTNFNRDNSNIGSEYSKQIETDADGNIWIAAALIEDSTTGHGGISIFKSTITNTQEASAETPLPIHLFPNPTKTFFQIDNELMQEMPVQIQVFDLRGRLIKSVSNSLVVHTHDMPTGMYAVLVQTDERQYASKILITD